MSKRGSRLQALGFILLLGSPVAAQTAEEKAGARAAAESGGAAFEAGRYEDAIDYFSRAEQIVHALPHLLYLARSYEKLGRLVEARETYLRIENEELAPGANQFLKDTKKIASSELATLEPRVPYISVVVQGAGNEPVQVMRNGQEMPRALVGIPQPMDPGEHSFQASAPGKESSLQKVTVKEGSQETVLLTLRDGGSTPATAASGSSSSGAPTDDGGGGGGPSTLQILGYGGLGLGVAGLAVGTIFTVQSVSTRGDADGRFDECNPGCSDTEIEAIDNLDAQADSDLTIGIIGLSAGALLAGAGVTFLLLDDPAEASENPASAGVRPWIGFGSAGLRGRF